MPHYDGASSSGAGKGYLEKPAAPTSPLPNREPSVQMASRALRSLAVSSAGPFSSMKTRPGNDLPSLQTWGSTVSNPDAACEQAGGSPPAAL